jgi:hypothetical protein
MKRNSSKSRVTRASSRRAVKKSNTKKSPGLRLAVGEPWDEPLEVHVEDSGAVRRDKVNVLMAVAFLVLLFALTANAMVHRDQATLKESLSITKVGLAFVAVWAGGRAALKVLSGWHDRR